MTSVAKIHPRLIVCMQPIFISDHEGELAVDKHHVLGIKRYICTPHFKVFFRNNYDLERTDYYRQYSRYCRQYNTIVY